MSPWTSRIFETGRLCVENRYGPQESVCEECDQNDCSNAMHDSSSQVNISEFESDNTSTENYARVCTLNIGLNVANVNICHMKPKLDEIKLLLNSSFKLDILGLCETFLYENTKDNILHMEGFNLERKDRAAFKQATLNTKRGGGVVVYIADHIQYKRRNDLQISETESIWLENNLKNTKPILIGSIYRPPSSSEFSLQIEKAISSADEIYFLGDFNINLLSDGAQSRTPSHSLEAFEFSELIKEPTRVTAHSATLVDHIYSNQRDKVTECFVMTVTIRCVFSTKQISKLKIKNEIIKLSNLDHQVYKF